MADAALLLSSVCGRLLDARIFIAHAGNFRADVPGNLLIALAAESRAGRRRVRSLWIDLRCVSTRARPSADNTGKRHGAAPVSIDRGMGRRHRGTLCRAFSWTPSYGSHPEPKEDLGGRGRIDARKYCRRTGGGRLRHPSISPRYCAAALHATLVVLGGDGNSTECRGTDWRPAGIGDQARRGHQGFRIDPARPWRSFGPHRCIAAGFAGAVVCPSFPPGILSLVHLWWITSGHPIETSRHSRFHRLDRPEYTPDRRKLSRPLRRRQSGGGTQPRYGVRAVSSLAASRNLARR